MEPRAFARLLFTLLATVIAAVAVLAVNQLPDNWRLGIVAWLLVGVPLLLVATRVLLRVAHLRAHQERSAVARPEPARPTKPPAPKQQYSSSLRVIISDSAGTGRFVIR